MHICSTEVLCVCVRVCVCEGGIVHFFCSSGILLIIILWDPFVCNSFLISGGKKSSFFSCESFPSVLFNLSPGLAHCLNTSTVIGSMAALASLKDRSVWYFSPVGCIKGYDKAGLFWTLLEANMRKHQGRKWMTCSLTCVFFLTTIWGNGFETIRRCAATSVSLVFGILFLCWFKKCRDGRNRYDVLENTISRLIRQGMYLNQKSPAEHSWLCRRNAKQWEYSWTDLCRNKTKRDGNFHRRLHLVVQEDGRMFYE